MFNAQILAIKHESSSIVIVSSITQVTLQLLLPNNAISPIFNELHLRRTATYLGGIESKLLSLNKIARIFNENQRPVLQRVDIKE